MPGILSRGNGKGKVPKESVSKVSEEQQGGQCDQAEKERGIIAGSENRKVMGTWRPN